MTCFQKDFSQVATLPWKSFCTATCLDYTAWHRSCSGLLKDHTHATILAGAGCVHSLKSKAHGLPSSTFSRTLPGHYHQTRKISAVAQKQPQESRSLCILMHLVPSAARSVTGHPGEVADCLQSRWHRASAVRCFGCEAVTGTPHGEPGPWGMQKQ